jgi:hypothetical protein
MIARKTLTRAKTAPLRPAIYRDGPPAAGNPAFIMNGGR